jgi:molybdopterin biosynthesis enzyme
LFASLEDTIAKAAALVRAPRKTRTVSLPEAGGEVLAMDIAADRNIPPFPRAAMVHMAMLVKPLFLKASGAREYLPKPVFLPLAGEAHNRSIGKKFTPARIVSKGGKSVVAEIPSNGSGDFISALRAEGVFEIPAGVSHLGPGDLVGFHPVWGDLFQDEG